jgi:hypothetical protein
MALGIEMDTAEAPIRAVQTQRPGLWDLTPTHHGPRNGVGLHAKADEVAVPLEFG